MATGKPYRGINVFMLSAAGYASPYWLTFNQARKLGHPIKKGEHGWPVVFWKFLDSPAEGLDDTAGKGRPMLRYYTVFNAAQCQGLDVPYTPQAARDFQPIAACEAVLAG